MNTPDVYLKHYDMRFMVYFISQYFGGKKTVERKKQKFCPTINDVQQLILSDKFM